jgi:hypothetical protein
VLGEQPLQEFADGQIRRRPDQSQQIVAVRIIHEIPEAQAPAFRARLSNLKRLAIVKSSGARGKRLPYGADDIYLLAFAVELAEFNIEPNAIKRIVSEWREGILGAFEQTKQDAADAEHLWLLFQADFISPRPSIDEPREPIRRLQKRRESEMVPRQIMHWLGPRFGAINISLLRARLDEAWLNSGRGLAA